MICGICHGDFAVCRGLDCPPPEDFEEGARVKLRPGVMGDEVREHGTVVGKTTGLSGGVATVVQFDGWIRMALSPRDLLRV